MIAPAYITEWSQHCPWITPAQVEQDLVLSRALVDIYADPLLRDVLLFRGGTALHKVVLTPPARYSEDLDFVQLRPEPIGDTLDLIKARLDPWLGKPKSDRSARGATLTYRFESELPPVIRLRLKIEINTREHLCLLPVNPAAFEVRSRWFTGDATIPVYANSELLGTKLRALYQRRKGRDLFDLWHAHQSGVLHAAEVAMIFSQYMDAEGHPVTALDFEENLRTKLKNPAFLTDTPALLRPGLTFDHQHAGDWVLANLIPNLD
ncbi:MAG TPA: nucleotidyl transferase AbiEii/AbiGii toxin family protein [Kiritimatiellia bacterium]|nr:nucleotidyl transferase AbiEii/AbiGii toxin family protein [Kiritimatiellia bacterium]